DPTCMKMDETLYGIAEKVKNFAVIYLVDITEVPDFNKALEDKQELIDIIETVYR
ncbi:7556_t:CDS:2, partial [Cetraspora pellucida]